MWLLWSTFLWILTMVSIYIIPKHTFAFPITLPWQETNIIWKQRTWKTYYLPHFPFILSSFSCKYCYFYRSNISYYELQVSGSNKSHSAASAYLFSKIFLLVTPSLSEIQLFPALSSLDLLHSSFPAWIFIFAMVHDFNENKFISIEHFNGVVNTVQLHYSFKHSFQGCVVVHTAITWFYCTCSGITYSWWDIVSLEFTNYPT